ncbi:PAS domain S-box protein [Clostridium frigoris]|uniref:histidine kinase n=1 Tax=Clostridium frigoris TaxID=205327 RepID=A0ABS6BWZ4_9CLOT|nr:ATP-binding protein [Clostridium frigoris]MBU3160978.1 PAS domain S-box protein [Clostridium frigoris]
MGITKPCLYSQGGIITKVNSEFIDFTGFTIDELLGKSLQEMGAMIRINAQILLDNIKDKYFGYVFTKSLSAREVKITMLYDEKLDENVYAFVEKPCSRIDDKMIFIDQTLSDNKVGIAVYTVPDLIMVKANQKYLDINEFPYNEQETSIGLSINEIVTGYVGTQSEGITNNVIKSRKSSYLKAIKFERFDRGITYWDSNRTPIFEDGVMKYIMCTTSEVTERVLKNQRIELQNNMIEEQKKQLEQKNIQLNSILENLAEGIVLTDNKGKCLMINKEARKLIYQSDRLTDLGDTFKNTKYFDMEGNKMLIKDLPGIRALRGEPVKNVKMFVVNPEKEHYMNNSAIPIYNNGELTNVVSCFHEITKRVKLTRKISEQKKELEAIIENISDSVAVFDNKEQYTLLNKASRDMFISYYNSADKMSEGYKPSEFYNILGEKIKLENTPACRVLRGEKFKNMKMLVKSQSKTIQVDVSGTPIYDSEGKFTRGVVCSRDMTDYFKHEEDIKSRYEFMNRMIDTMDLAVVRLSCPILKIEDINQKAFSLIKLLLPNVKSVNQIKNSKSDLFRGLKKDEYSQCISDVLREKKTKHLNKKKYVVKGKEIYWNVVFEPLFGIDGEIKEILVLVIDVTNEINSNILMEKELKQQGEFLANISHELKTPLNVIFAAVQLFEMYFHSGSLDDRKNSIIKYIKSIKQNSYRLSKLINNIVDTSKIEAGFFDINLSNNNIIELVEDIVMSVTHFTESRGLNIIFDTNIEEKIIACDPDKIERIVLNLISNAIKFSSTGGEILVAIKDKNEFIEISVKDNGVGIQKKHLEMIFDRFKQVDKSLSRNAEGTGIGLSLVKSIAELHGGSISVESEYGKGSKFTVKLPSEKVLKENMIYNNEVRSHEQNIRVELSDVYS